MIESRNDFHKILPDHGRFVEVGTWTGAFAKIIASWRKHRELYLVDPWRPLPDYKDAINKTSVEKFNHIADSVRGMFATDPSVWIIRAPSNEAVHALEDESVDWVYIDANHDYEHTSEDIRIWYPKVKPGGIVSGHDYADCTFDDGTEFGVKSAVNDFVQERWPVHHLTAQKDNSWYFVKEG